MVIKMNTKKLGMAFANIFLYLFIGEIISYYLDKFIFFESTFWMNFYFLIAPSIAGTTIILLNQELFKSIFQNFKKNYKQYIPLIIKYYFSGLILMYLCNAIIMPFTNTLPENETTNRLLFNTLPIFSIINTLIIAPISEEIIFRGTFKKVFKQKQAFLIATSFLFGLLHVIFNGDFINIFPYAALGYFLGKIYYETDNILNSIIAHAFHNALCILLLFLGGIL